MRNGVDQQFAQGAVLTYLYLNKEPQHRTALLIFFISLFRNRYRKSEKMERAFNKALEKLSREGWINVAQDGRYTVSICGRKLGK